MILSLLVLGGTLAFLAWLIFTFAVYALPCFAAVCAGSLAYHSGAGAPGVGLIGLVAGTLAFAVGHTAFATARTPIIRLAILALFVLPAGLAGFGIARDVARITASSGGWQTMTGVLGSAVTMAAAFARLTTQPERAARQVSRPAPTFAADRS